jgi:hypothetical protein
METKSKRGVEIFSVGTWNGDTYTEKDLDEMVRAFDANSTTFKPPLKLGHDDKQELLQRDGYPAAGWVERVYRQGEKLLADFIDIPNKIYELIESGAYKKVSSEIFWGIEIGENKYDRMLAGVALLGADVPAVMNLNDIMAMYADRVLQKKFYAEEKNQPTIKTYQFAEDTKVTEQEVKAMQEKIAALELQAKENQELKAYKTDAETKIKDLQERVGASEKEAQEARVEKDVNELSTKLGLTAAMKPYIKEFVGYGEKKEYSFGEKKLSRAELLEEILGLHAEALKLNTKEQTLEGKKEDKDLEKKIKDYMKDNKCSYAEAYRAVGKK